MQKIQIVKQKRRFETGSNLRFSKQLQMFKSCRLPSSTAAIAAAVATVETAYINRTIDWSVCGHDDRASNDRSSVESARCKAASVKSANWAKTVADPDADTSHTAVGSAKAVVSKAAAYSADPDRNSGSAAVELRLRFLGS